MSLIPSQLDNLRIAGLQNASISLFSNVARQMQITNGSHAGGWANTVAMMHKVVLADNLRVQNIDKLPSTQFYANAIISAIDVQHTDQSLIDQSSGNIPNGINYGNGIIVASAIVHVPEKTFANAMSDSYTANNSANVVALNNFIIANLNNNNVYSQANVVSTLDYALKYGHLTNWNNLTKKDFDLSTHTTQVQGLYETGHTTIQTAMATYLP
jgi:hypothetical protein